MAVSRSYLLHSSTFVKKKRKVIIPPFFSFASFSFHSHLFLHLFIFASFLYFYYYNVRPDFGPDIFGPDFCTGYFGLWTGFWTGYFWTGYFRTGYFQTGFRTGFLDQILDRILDQISDQILDRISDRIFGQVFGPDFFFKGIICCAISRKNFLSERNIINY